MSKSPRQLTVRTVTLTTGGGLFSPVRRDTFLDKLSLVESLHEIKDNAEEEHTKRNIQTLIDMLVTVHTTA